LEAIERRKKMLSDRYDLKLKKKNGDYVLCEVSGSPYVDKNGNNIGSLVIFTDITFRKSAETQLKLYNSQLEQKNKVLEQFVYIASHDLQEPLRTVSGFVELFEKKYSNTLDENALTYINYIHGATDRMQLLIKDLLDYSRIGRKKEMELIECDQLVKEVVDDLSQLIKDKKASIKLRRCPKFSATAQK
jgi:light-regulated signal transduction histidine kinase (bacteriophytochrome)